MAGEIEHIKGKGFDANPENINRDGRPVGSKNRSTLLRKWLEVPAKITNPETKEEVIGTVEDRIIMALIAKAAKGDVSAIKEIQDTMHGKTPDIIQTQNLEPITGVKIVKDDS